MKQYDVEYRDCEGDVYESNFETMSEAMDFIRELANEDCRVVRTWMYVDGEYQGSFY